MVRDPRVVQVNLMERRLISKGGMSVRVNMRVRVNLRASVWVDMRVSVNMRG